MSTLQAIPTQHGIDILNSELKNTVTKYRLIGALTHDAPSESLYSFYENTIETSYYDDNGVLTFILNLPIEQHFDEYLHQIHVLDSSSQSVIECSTPKVALPKGIGGMVTLKAAISGEAGQVIFKHDEFVTETELKELFLPQKENANNAASNEDIDSGSTASKHIKLPQFWRGIAKQLTARFSELNLKTNVMSFVSKAGLYTGWNNGDPVDSGGLSSVVGNQLQIMSAAGHATQLFFGDGYAKFRPQWGSGRWVDFFTTSHRPKMSDISGMTMVAMVNFDGATPNVPARGSFNVKRIIDNGIGDYTIEFENPVSIDKRVIIFGQFAILDQADAYTFGEHVKADTTPTLISETQIRVLSRRERNVDVSRAYVIVFGELA